MWLAIGIRFDGFLAWLVWLVVHIFFLIGFRNRLFVMAQVAWYYLAREHGARVIMLEDESAAVKSTIRERLKGSHSHVDNRRMEVGLPQTDVPRELRDASGASVMG